MLLSQRFQRRARKPTARDGESFVDLLCAKSLLILGGFGASTG
jgi:hypothetical protein